MNTPDTKQEKHSHNNCCKILFIVIVNIMFIASIYYVFTMDTPLSCKTDNPVIQRLVENMIRVEGGEFTMGATSEQSINIIDPDEKPTHQVEISSFYIGKFEVSQIEWSTVMGNNPSRIKGDSLPVGNISWDDCQNFLNKLNEMTGEKFRLPTEAEWEYAARGGNKSKGYIYSGSDTLAFVAWYDRYFDKEPRTLIHAPLIVGTKKPNELGIYDMSGNISEWCYDKLGEYSSEKKTNPTGVEIGTKRIIRGGNWGNDNRFCRVSNRDGYTPKEKNTFTGFRLAR